jgi:entericidin A
VKAYCDRFHDQFHDHFLVQDIMKKALALSLVAILLAGCNTVSGIGRDVSKVGQVVTGAGGK